MLLLLQDDNQIDELVFFFRYISVIDSLWIETIDEKEIIRFNLVWSEMRRKSKV